MELSQCYGNEVWQCPVFIHFSRSDKGLSELPMIFGGVNVIGQTVNRIGCYGTVSLLEGLARAIQLGERREPSGQKSHRASLCKLSPIQVDR